MKKILALISYLLLSSATFMQAGASLFAIVVNVSTLIEAPPESLKMVQGKYAFNPDVFWNNFPNVVTILFVLALILNWKNSLRKWILIGFGIFILSALVAILWLGPVQEEFLSTPFSNSIDPDLMKLGLKWRNISLLFFISTLFSGFAYIYGLTLQNLNLTRRPTQ